MPHTRIQTNYDIGPEGRILIASLEADPAAGAEIVVTVPGRAVWEIMAVRYNLVADATVTTRQPHLDMDDGENIFATVPAVTGTAATFNFTYVAYQGAVSDDVFGTSLSNPLPIGLVMLPGWRVLTRTVNLQAGDNYAAPVLYVREIPQRGIEVGQDALRSALRRLIGEEA